MKKVLLIVVCTCSLAIASAQNCSQRLNRAEDDYEAGRLLQIPEVINDLLLGLEGPYKCELSKEEEIRARKLLTKAYIFMDNEADAETALIGLLKRDPEHVLDKQVDPRELFFLMDQFRTDPIFRISIRGGVNVTYVNVIDDFGAASSTSVSDFSTNNFPKFYNGKTADGETSYQVSNFGVMEEYTPISGVATGFNAELMLERHLLKGIEVGLGGQVRWSRYNVDAYLTDKNLVSTLTNQQVYLRIPLLVRYNLWYDNHKHLLKPYVYGGFSSDFLLSATYIEGTRNGGTAFSLSNNKDNNEDLKAKNQVNTVDYSIFGGLGLKFRIATHYLTLEARYDNALNNYINSDNRYLNKSTAIDMAFAEDNLSLNNLSFTFGFAYSIYSPKKLKDYN